MYAIDRFTQVTRGLQLYNPHTHIILESFQFQRAFDPRERSEGDLHRIISLRHLIGPHKRSCRILWDNVTLTE